MSFKALLPSFGLPTGSRCHLLQCRHLCMLRRWLCEWLVPYTWINAQGYQYRSGQCGFLDCNFWKVGKGGDFWDPGVLEQALIRGFPDIQLVVLSEVWMVYTWIENLHFWRKWLVFSTILSCKIRLWKEMVESKVLCSAAISACESGSQWQVAFEIFRQQEELGLGKSKTHSAVFCWTGLFKLEWDVGQDVAEVA